MTTLKIATCHCCGATLTKPQFFNGKVYGYTCINKVAGKGHKKSKNVMVEVELLKIVLPENTSRINKILVKVGNTRVNLGTCYADRDEVLNNNIENLRGGDRFTLCGGKMFINKKLHDQIIKDNM